MRYGVGDALAEIAGAAATLRVLAAGAEDIGRLARARPYGGVDVAFPNGLTDAEIHVVATVFHSCDLFSDAKILTAPDLVKRPESPSSGTFPGPPAAPRRSGKAFSP